MSTFERIVIEPFQHLFEKILQFLPNLLTSVLIFVVGIIAAALVKLVFARLFHAFKIDASLERFGLTETLGKGGIKEPVSGLLSRALGWITLVAFLIMSLRALDVPALEHLLERFFLYLPNIFVALLILFFGYILSNFLGRAVLIAAVNAGIKVSGVIGKFARITIFILAVTMALEQLGIGTGTVIIAFAIAFGGVVLALALAFGLGGKDMAREYLEKKLLKPSEKDDIEHL
jgi:small-conductance mechanosensitive channel